MQFLFLGILLLEKLLHLEDWQSDHLLVKLYPLLLSNFMRLRLKLHIKCLDFIFGILVHVQLISWTKGILAFWHVVINQRFSHVDGADAVVLMYDLTSFGSLHTARELLNSMYVNTRWFMRGKEYLCFYLATNLIFAEKMEEEMYTKRFKV